MRALSKSFIIGVIGFEIIIVFFMLFHLGGITWQFSQLAGAIVGGIIALVAVNIPLREGEANEPMLGRERLAWTLVGCGLISWGIGESFWRYYILTNQSPFPSYADFGYSGLPLLILAGMLLQPSSGSGRRRALILLDSFISMGALLAIGWYLLLGDLALHSTVENPLAKFLGLYYPTTDVALLSCVAILLLRRQGRLYQATARRISLIVVGIGLCFFATSDFAFNLLQNAGTYVEGTWVDLGWPLGLITIGLAVYLRRFLPLTSEDQIEKRLRRRAERFTFGPEQFVPYILLGVLFVVLVLNIISTDPGQRDIRPILLIATLGVVGLVVIRQILTQLENERLARRQADALERLEVANRRVEEQAHMIAERNAALEMGVTHLKDVQARLANGNLRARARLSSGELLPLAASLNLMADRLMRLEQTDIYSQRLTRALAELSIAIERYRKGAPFMIPVSCNDFTEINQLLLALGLKEKVEYSRVAYSSSPSGQLPPRPQDGTKQSQPFHQSGQNQLRNSQTSWPGQKTWPETARETRQRANSGALAAQDFLRNGSEQE
jgi:hypothetical protein